MHASTSNFWNKKSVKASTHQDMDEQHCQWLQFIPLELAWPKRSPPNALIQPPLCFAKEQCQHRQESMYVFWIRVDLLSSCPTKLVCFLTDSDRLGGLCSEQTKRGVPLTEAGAFVTNLTVSPLSSHRVTVFRLSPSTEPLKTFYKYYHWYGYITHLNV